MAQRREDQERPSLAVVVAANIYRIRTDQGLSQEKLAHRTDLSRDTIRVIENARDPEKSMNSLRLDTLERIALALAVEPGKLLQWDAEATRV